MFWLVGLLFSKKNKEGVDKVCKNVLKVTNIAKLIMAECDI